MHSRLPLLCVVVAVTLATFAGPAAAATPTPMPKRGYRVLQEDDDSSILQSWLDEFPRVVVLFTMSACQEDMCSPAEDALKTVAKAVFQDDDHGLHGKVGFVMIAVNDISWLNQFINTPKKVPTFRLYRHGHLIDTQMLVNSPQSLMFRLEESDEAITRLATIEDAMLWVPSDGGFDAASLADTHNNVTFVFAFCALGSPLLKAVETIVESNRQLIPGVIYLHTSSAAVSEHYQQQDSVVVWNGEKDLLATWPEDDDEVDDNAAANIGASQFDDIASKLFQFVTKATRPLILSMNKKEMVAEPFFQGSFLLICDICMPKGASASTDVQADDPENDPGAPPMSALPASNSMLQYFYQRLAPLARKYPDIGFRIQPGSAALHYLGYEADTDMKRGAVYFMLSDKERYRPRVTPARFNATEVGRFVQDVVDGVLPPYVLSEPLPVGNPPLGQGDARVVTVVGSNTEGIVFNKAYDVLLLVYGDYTNLKENAHALRTFEELARQLSGRKDLIVAKLQGDKNELPAGANDRSFPKAYIFPIHGKDLPEMYAPREALWDLAHLKNFFLERAYSVIIQPEDPPPMPKLRNPIPRHNVVGGKKRPEDEL